MNPQISRDPSELKPTPGQMYLTVNLIEILQNRNILLPLLPFLFAQDVDCV